MLDVWMHLAVDAHPWPAAIQLKLLLAISSEREKRMSELSKLLSVIIYFLREMIFDSKDEYDFKSAKFNARKFATLLVMLLLLLLQI